MVVYTHVRLILALSSLSYVLIGSAAAQLMGQELDKNTGDISGLPTYSRNVSEVRVTFFATDEDNHPLESVTQSDFAVVDDEHVVRNFRSFTHSNEVSLDVVALVDLSESVAPRFQVALGSVLQLVAREQLIPDDRMSVVSFGGISSTLLCSSDCRATHSASRLLALKSGGATPLFDALVFAAEFISEHRRAGGRSDARPVLILFSDGNDTISRHAASEALEALLAAGALVYSVDLGTWDNRAPKHRPPNHRAPNGSGSTFLQQLSEATGGRYFLSSPRFSQTDGAATVLNAIRDDLRASYVVTYAMPGHQAGFHSLRLLPTHKLNLTFHSRNGYNYEPSGD